MNESRRKGQKIEVKDKNPPVFGSGIYVDRQNTRFKRNLRVGAPSKERKNSDSGMKLEWTQTWRPENFTSFSDDRNILGVTRAKMGKDPEATHHFKLADLKLYCA